MGVIPSTFEEMIFEVMDKCKFLFFPEQRYDFFLDCSKNEIFTLFFVYRKHQVNMSDIAVYMNIPLNTVTGVAGRLEKKGLVLRQRSESDKRVVTLVLTEEGEGFMKRELSGLGDYFARVMGALAEEEKATLFELIDKVFGILNQRELKAPVKTEKRVKKITIL